MTDKPRIRDLYRSYSEGQIPFEDVVRAADRVLEKFDAERTLGPSVESPARATTKPQRD